MTCLVAREYPGNELPVATGPAMLAFDSHIVTRREFVDYLDVGGKAGARENSLEQIMAEQRILRDAVRKRCFEGIDVVDAFAGIGALTEQVLVDVGDGSRVGIHSAGAGVDALID